MDYFSAVLYILILVIIIISSEARFTVQPQSVVQAEGLEAVFECQYQAEATVGYDWLINGQLHALDTPLVSAQLPSLGAPATLRMVATPQSSNTLVQCEADIRNGTDRRFEISSTATLTSQGISILDMTSGTDTIDIIWATNNFTTAITYCVEINQTVLGSTENIQLSPVCGLTGTQYTFSYPGHTLCDRFSFTVTPTEGGKRGTTSQPVTANFHKRRVLEDHIHCGKSGENGDPNCEVIFISPLSCDCELVFSTTDAPELEHIQHTQMIYGNQGSRYPLDKEIQSNRNYSVNITLISSEIMYNQKPTSHDIMNASVNQCSMEGAINTSCTFVPNTTATGYLAIVSEVTCEPERKSTVFQVIYNTTETYSLTEGIGRGNYNVMFFDVESDGLPDHSSDGSTLIGSAQMTSVQVLNGSRTQNHLDSGNSLAETRLEVLGNDVCVYCSSVEDCVVLIHACSNPDVAYSLYMLSGEEKCTRVAKSQNYSVAFFVHNGSLRRYPGKIDHFLSSQDLTGSSSAAITTTTLTTFDVSGGSSSTTIIVAPASTVVCVLLLLLGGIIGAYCIWYSVKNNSFKVSKCRENTEPWNTQIYRLSAEGIEDTERACRDDAPKRYELEEQIGFDIPDPTYAVVDSRRVMVKKGAADKELMDSAVTHSPYVEIASHQHEAQVYAHVELRTRDPVTSEDKVDTAQVEYAVLDHGKLVAREDTGQEPTTKEVEAPPILPPKPTPLLTETLHALLSPAEKKWYEIGLAMGLSNHSLENEIHPGNSTDWLRLGEVCVLFCLNKHTWEEVVHIMWAVEEWEIADKICRQEKLQVKHPVAQDETPPSLPLKATKGKV